MRIYLDICSIQRPLDDQSQLRIRTETEAILGILDLCETGRLTLVSSAAHVIETEQNPYPDRKGHALNVLSLASHYVRAHFFRGGRAGKGICRDRNRQARCTSSRPCR